MISELTRFFPNTADLVYLTKDCNIMDITFSAIVLNKQSFDQCKKSGPGFWKFNARVCWKVRENIQAFIDKTVMSQILA